MAMGRCPRLNRCLRIMCLLGSSLKASYQATKNHIRAGGKSVSQGHQGDCQGSWAVYGNPGGNGEAPMAQPEIKDKDRAFLLDTRLVPPGLFGVTGSTVVERFLESKKQMETYIYQYLPHRQRHEQPQRSSSSYQAQKKEYRISCSTSKVLKAGMTLSTKVFQAKAGSEDRSYGEEGKRGPDAYGGMEQ